MILLVPTVLRESEREREKGEGGVQTDEKGGTIKSLGWIEKVETTTWKLIGQEEKLN